MAPLVITVPSGVKLMVNDVELAKAVILDCLTRPHTLESPQLAPTQSASPSFASRKSVTTRSDLETHTSFDVGKPAARNATRSDFMPDSRKTASIQSSSRKSASVAISATRGARKSTEPSVKSGTSPLRLSNRFDALASEHSEDSCKPDLHCLGIQLPSSRSSITSSGSSSDEEMQECPDCSNPLKFWCTTCRGFYSFEK